MEQIGMPSVNLYQIPQVIQTTQAGAVGVNSATNKIDFDVSKNVTTEVEFLLKNIDRKLIIDPTNVLIMYIVDPGDQSIKMQKRLDSVTPGRGHFRLTISPSDIIDWSPGYYAYSVVILRAIDQSQILIHSNQNRSQYGFLEVKPGPIPSPIPPAQWEPSDANKRFDLNPVVDYFISGAYAGSAQRDNRYGQHTCVIYTKNYTGTFKVQASLENGIPSSIGEWFDIDDAHTTLNKSTGAVSIQFVGSVMWVRFLYVPALTNQGIISKVLFKN